MYFKSSEPLFDDLLMKKMSYDLQDFTVNYD